MRKVSDAELAALKTFNQESLKAYGRGTIKLTRTADGRHCFKMENKAFRLTDEFDGGNPFCGIVRIIRKSDNAAVWNSYYHGWITECAAKYKLPPEHIFNFMREALRHAGPDSISFGPSNYRASTGGLRYTNRLEYGDIACFYGTEKIYFEDDPEPVYIRKYGGGVVNLSEDAGEAAIEAV